MCMAFLVCYLMLLQVQEEFFIQTKHRESFYEFTNKSLSDYGELLKDMDSFN